MSYTPAMQAAVVHALEEYPRESVGYINGESYVRLTNICEDGDDHHFVISEDEELAAYQHGIDLFVHSHSSGHACPSADDMAHQEKSGVLWAIIVIRPPEQSRPQPELLEVFTFGAEMPILDYEGRPFRHGVNDCYSLVRDWWRQEKNIKLPYFPRDDEWWKDDKNLIMDCMAAANFQPISGDDLQVGDVVIMSVGHHMGKHLANHMAVYVGNGLILHHFAGRYSRHDPLHMYRQHHVAGYARYGGKS